MIGYGGAGRGYFWMKCRTGVDQAWESGRIGNDPPPYTNSYTNLTLGFPNLHQETRFLKFALAIELAWI